MANTGSRSRSLKFDDGLCVQPSLLRSAAIWQLEHLLCAATPHHLCADHNALFTLTYAAIQHTSMACIYDNGVMSELTSMRLDKWLWAARFYKTRALAVEQINKGRVSINASAAKPAREVRIGDMIALRQGDVLKTLQVLGLSAMRGPAPQAQLLYAETAQSIAQREQVAEQRRIAPEPALTLSMRHDGRPSKKDRRDIDRARQQWDNRWSASLPDA